MEKSNKENNNDSFREIIAGYTNEELKQVLKKRNRYRPEAADFAVQEAIRRGIIYSEQDLFAKEYQPVPRKFSLFPEIENSETKAKFRMSITRALMFLGVVPVVWGLLGIFGIRQAEGIAIIIYGAVWCLIVFRMRREIKPTFVYFMYFLLILAVAFIIKNFIVYQNLNNIDIVVAIVAVGFAFYAIAFLSKLQE